MADADQIVPDSTSVPSSSQESEVKTNSNTDADSASVPSSSQESEVKTNSNTDAVTSPPLTARRILIFFLASFVYFLTWACVSMWAPFFPGEAAERGVSSTETGFIFGIYNLVSFLSSLVYGPFLIPQTGPYFVLFSGLFLCGGANLICGFVNLMHDRVTFSLFCFIVRAVAALGGSACETSIVVILTQEFQETLAFAIGLLEVFTGLGFVVGPVLGGGLYSLGGFRLPMVVTGGTLLVFMPLIWLLLPRRDHVETENRQSRSSLFKQVIAIPGVIIMCMTCCVTLFSVSFLDPTLEPHAKTFGVNSTGVALLFLAFSGSYTLTSPIAGYILNRKPLGRTFVVIGLFGSAAGFLFLGPAPFLASIVPTKELWLVLVSLLVSGLFGGLVFVPVLPEMMRCSHEKGLSSNLQLDSMLSGFYTGFCNLGACIGPVSGGILNEHFGFAWTATTVSLLLAGQALLSFIFFACDRRRGATLLRTTTTSENERLIGERAVPDYSTAHA